MTDFEKLRSFYTGKKVLVTGHTGFKGSYLLMILSVLGARVYGYALKSPADPALFEIIYGEGLSSRTETELRTRFPAWSAPDPEPGVIEESHIGDIRDMDTLSETYARIRPDIVIHMAAQPIVREGYRDPLLTYDVNVMGTVHILECVRTYPSCKAFLNVTTDKVYLNNDDHDPLYGFKETDPLDGADPYANSKSCSEIVTHSYAASFLSSAGVAVSTARAGNSIGGGDFSRDRILADAARAALSGGTLVVRNPLSVRPYQHVFEPLFAYLSILMASYQDPRYAGWYNVGPDAEDAVTTGELASMFTEDFGEGMAWTSISELDAPHESGYLRLDNTLIKERLSWHQTWGIESAVRAVASWTRAYREGPEAANGELMRELMLFIRGEEP